MSDLRKAAEMALERLESHDYWADEEAIQALRQALNDKPAVKSYCGGKPNYTTPQPEVCCGEYARCLKVCIPKERWFAQQKLNVDAVNMTPDRVDETAKGEHEPVAWFIQYEDSHEFVWSKPDGWRAKQALEIQPLYTAPPKKEYQYEVVAEHANGTYTTKRIPKREWVGLTDEEIQAERHKLDQTAGWTYDHFARAIEAKLKEKNSG